jgi:hypothetical protein
MDFEIQPETAWQYYFALTRLSNRKAELDAACLLI